MVVFTCYRPLGDPSDGALRGGKVTSQATSNGKLLTIAAQAGVATRFGQRWRVVGAGLSNVWRFGDLELPAASGRLLLRGPNGTGKTTALESLAPYLLDLNAAKLSAGKARTTNLAGLMREGAAGKRRYGYAWMTLEHPKEGRWSFGVRIQFSEGASPPVSVIPFGFPGRPLHELKLYGSGRSALTADQFKDAVVAGGGQIFPDEEAYVAHLAVRLFATPEREQVALLGTRLRQVRNPSLLGDLSAQGAADALRESLPGVAPAVVKATSDALAESDATRAAFKRDTDAAETLDDFRSVWSAHATEVVQSLLQTAIDAAREVKRQQAHVKTKTAQVQAAEKRSADARVTVESLETQTSVTRSEIEALEKHEAYAKGGRLKELKKAAIAERQAASSAALTMQTTAAAVAKEADSLRSELENITDDLEELRTQVRQLAPEADDGAPLVRWNLRTREPVRAGDVVADPGSEVVLQTDVERLLRASASWRDVAIQRQQMADAAHLAIIDHQPVAALEKEVDTKGSAARSAGDAANREAGKAKTAEANARALSKQLLDRVASWVASRSDFAKDAAGGVPWRSEELEAIAAAEPSQILATTEAWGADALAKSEAVAAGNRSEAKKENAEASKLRDEARALRDKATEMRSGKLLPFPRPGWTGAGDDDSALGAVLDWRQGFDDPRELSLLEAALAASGLLAATLDAEGANTSEWAVAAVGPVLENSLHDVIAVDEAHPHADLAKAVISRIGLEPSARVAEGVGLVIGRDGTFSAGVLRGDATAREGHAVPVASHVGARQRKAAAIARAEQLELSAVALEADAASREARATELVSRAERVAADGQAFPARNDLRNAEALRAGLASIAADAKAEASRADALLAKATTEHRLAYDDWCSRTRARGLQPDVDALVQVRDQGRHVTEELLKRATRLGGKLVDRFTRAVHGYSADSGTARLTRDQASARLAHETAAGTEHQVRVLEATAGAAIAEVTAKHDAATARLADLRKQLDPARDEQFRFAKLQATEEEALNAAVTKLQEELEPRAVQALAALRGLLGEPGVAEAVLDGKPIIGDEGVMAQLEAALKGRRTLTRKTLLERYDMARAKLAGVWSIDPGDPHGDLLTYTLTYRDAVYSPIDAAAYANKLKERAQQALQGSEEKALREFVIGRLPTAIGTAWTRLRDWEREVNRKMRAAAASSGVGVQVRLPLRKDLPPVTQQVFELCCSVSDAERTQEQQRLLGQGLQTLIAAAQPDAEGMTAQVAAAVDIRDWVDVHYEIERADGKTQRLGPKTGLSTGERRLVLLAPMLAAVAAAYDKFGTSALRLVTLDEVPAEVDERGKEGLARYIAELDLDLICTSHLWDGSPGAWDGIDAHDLEAGSDGTVVAFPILIRGQTPIPEGAPGG